MHEGNPLLYEVLSAYCNDSSKCHVKALGQGNINETFLVQNESIRFVLQKINSSVFLRPLHLVENFEKIHDYVEKTKPDYKQSIIQLASPIRTLKDEPALLDSNCDVWRAQSFCSTNPVPGNLNKNEAYRIGAVLGQFHSLLQGFDGSLLKEPLPGFHDLVTYLNTYDERLTQTETDAGVTNFKYCVKLIDQYRNRATQFQHGLDRGVLSLQVTHGDPKIDNFIFDSEKRAVGLLDLDTVYLGYFQIDLGDCLRSCCNKFGENHNASVDDPFDIHICGGVLQGYFDHYQHRLSKETRLLIYEGLLQVCFELGVRFFSDHLAGDVYFGVRKRGDNLNRAVNQLHLTETVAKKRKQIESLLLSM